ncbi:conserved hypothetical protein [Streptomyces viridosporus ATCC 14672]|uniref:Uncharacterized protein n=1 Tax=Streptomyces viridosporus (strain ATCC 14672 / DSM 40746 / JCM 4963 / KCTC 9882 / NRRL B-12104 / FH 1290) TaxID=566461 RepID=D5ZVK3_STRV1|nr:conserved hypothetical protein [Streptomyces viridosporus ATCC 14672]
MDVIELLESASLLVPEEVATDSDITVRDVWDYLAQDEWQIALSLLEELGDGHPLPLAFWEQLAEAAERFRLERSATWCHWRCSEIRNGMIRADLTLRSAAEARRRTPIPGHGVLRPMWDIGRLSPTGDASVSMAGLWVEGMPFLEPGGRATVAWFRSPPHTGSTSKSANGSTCTRTGPWPAPQSCWRFTSLPPPRPGDDAGCPGPLTGAGISVLRGAVGGRCRRVGQHGLVRTAPGASVSPLRPEY